MRLKPLLVRSSVLLASAAMFAFSAAPAAAQSCSTTGAQGSCYGGTVYCGTNPFSCASPQSCGTEQVDNCCGGCVCPAARPNNCISTNGKCQAGNSSCSATFQTAVCDAAAGSSTQICGACVSGYYDCDATAAYDCRLGTSPTACLTPVYLSQAVGQTGYINVTGNITSSSGDFQLATTKSIRLTGMGTVGVVANAAFLNINNWDAGLAALYVGIGTDAPGYPLDVRSRFATGTATLRINNDNSMRLWTGLSMARQSTERWFVGMNATDDLFRIRRTVGGVSTDDLVIDATGKVGVANFQMVGQNPAAGKVLTSDASGNASWAFPAAGGGTFVGVLTPAGTGAQYGSYVAANTACYGGAGALAGSHVCTAEEILRTINAAAPAGSIAAFSAVNGTSAWVSGGPPGFTSPAVNDCAGWTSGSASLYGSIWTFAATGGAGYATTCDSSYSVACCK